MAAKSQSRRPGPPADGPTPRRRQGPYCGLPARSGSAPGQGVEVVGEPNGKCCGRLPPMCAPMAAGERSGGRSLAVAIPPARADRQTAWVSAADCEATGDSRCRQLGLRLSSMIASMAWQGIQPATARSDPFLFCSISYPTLAADPAADARSRIGRGCPPRSPLRGWQAAELVG